MPSVAKRLTKRLTLKLLEKWSNLKNRHFLLFDLVFLPTAVVMAFAIRLDSSGIRRYWRAMWIYALMAPLVKIAAFSALGMYKRFWQYGSVNEAFLLLSSVTVGVVLEAVIVLGFFVPAGLIRAVPRSIPILDWFLCLLVVGSARFSVRLADSYWRKSVKGLGKRGDRRRVLIMGAGEAGVMVAKELEANPQTGMVPVGFLDDDPDKIGLRVHGYEVLGSRSDIPSLVREYGIDQVIVAMPSAPGRDVREVVEICRRTGVEVKTIPGMYEIISGEVSIGQIRDISLGDLLRRKPVELDPIPVRRLLSGKRVLITGAGGSIGSELVRQVCRNHPAEVILLGHGENSIFEAYNELVHWTKEGVKFEEVGLRLVIADIRFPERVQRVFERFRPEIVFHAAAHKHVPLMELNPEEAITNNVLGTLNLLDASVSSDVERFVLISTDKAVNPTSVMGASKRVAELLVLHAARASGKPLAAVRFGNVLGSRGSVVLTFQKQIEAGGPITVTHPEVERYFMTIPEAVQLVLQAAALAKGGEIFVLDMGEPVKIVDVAKDMIRLAGLSEDKIEIVYTGLRPGEKLTEELFGKGEVAKLVSDKIFVVSGRTKVNEDTLSRIMSLMEAAKKGDEGLIISMLKEIVPTYTPTLRGL